MNLRSVYDQAKTGDVLLVHGASFIQEGIQTFTGCFCHAAQIIIPPAGGIIVEETVEGVGYQNMTLEDWLSGRVGQKIYYGKAPDAVIDGADKIMARFQYYDDPEKRKYHYDELFTVLRSTRTGEKYTTNGEVCSLLVQNNWAAAGYETPGNACPSDFLGLCESVSRINL
jgi:hypothetical protein